MRNHFFIILYLIAAYSYAQNTNERKNNCSDTIAISITAHPFFNNSNLSMGTIAIGPTIFLVDGNLRIQLGLLFDLMNYPIYKKATSPGNSVFPQKTYQSENYYSIIFPLLFHYNLYSYKKTKIYFTAGLLFGGGYYFDENNYTRKMSLFSLILGVGYSYNIFKGLNIRATPMVRHSAHTFFPGIVLDFSLDRCINIPK